MEKRTLVAILLCIGIFVGWSALSRSLWPPPPPRAPAPAGAVPAQGSTVPAPAPSPSHPAPPSPSDGPSAPARRARVATERVDLTVTSAGGGSIAAAEVWGCVHHAVADRTVAGDPGVVTSEAPGQAGFLAVGLVGAGADGLGTAPWEMEESGGGFRSSVERGGLRVRKAFRLSEDAAHPYHGTLTVTVENADARAGSSALLDVVGPWTPPHPHSVIPEDGVVLAAVDESVEQVAPADVLETLQEQARDERRAASGWRWIGVRSDFYFAGLLPAPATPLPPEAVVDLRAAQVAGARGAPPAVIASATLRIPFAVPERGASQSWEFLVYLGPNSRGVLSVEGSPYAPLADAYPERGFWIFHFGWITRLMSWLLAVLAEGLGMGWGLAVCGLTVLVRGALFPLSRKSQVSMRVHATRMAKLKPKLDAIKAKHSDNPKKQQELTMKLFREEKVSILPGGCLLAFLQMPVWISLYGTLQTTFEMRHASFLWFSDLTAPDHLVELPFARGWPIVGGWFNLLPLLMMVTWFGSSLMMPLPPDPEQRAQAKMMRWIPLLFGVFLYQTAAGLTLYMTLSALWSIGETWLIRRVWLSKLEPMPSAAPAKAG